MKNLELKHLAPYLPYGLKYYPSNKSDLFSDLYADHAPNSSWNYDLALQAKDDYALKISNSYLFQKQNQIMWDDNELFLGQMDSSLGFEIDDVYLSEVKPILRPLSDLTKEIEGKAYWLLLESDEMKYFKHKGTNIKKLSVKTYFNLLEEHFDVFGLIEKGLAIDINTLNK